MMSTSRTRRTLGLAERASWLPGRLGRDQTIGGLEGQRVKESLQARQEAARQAVAEIERLARRYQGLALRLQESLLAGQALRRSAWTRETRPARGGAD